MRKPCSILLLCVVLGFGVSMLAPLEDVPETAYDESEALPYVSTPVFSVAMPKAIVLDGQTVVAMLRPGSLRRPATQRSDQRIDSANPIGDFLTILDHALRC